MLKKALEFCIAAHGTQKRRYTGEPYYLHCQEVCREVSRRRDDPDLAAAALLHYVLEDTPVTYAELEAEFGARIAGLVLELTDQYTHERYPHLNRAARKALEADRIAGISADAKLIKLCDLADNTSTIVKHDPGFATVYLREKARLLEKMGYSADEDTK